MSFGNYFGKISFRKVINEMKINKNIFVTICAILMVRPYYVQLSKPINLLWAVITLIMAFLCVVNIFKYRNVKSDKFFFVFICVYLMATLLNCRENYISAISSCAQVSLAYCLGRLYESNAYKRKIAKCVPTVISIYIYIDFITIILGFSEKVFGMESSISFLGYDNYAAFYIVPMIGIKFSLDYVRKNKLNLEDWIFYGCSLLGKILTGSYTAMVAIAVIPIFAYTFSHLKDIRRCLNVKNFVVAISLLFIGVYFFNIQNVLSHLLSLMGKGITLNSRTVIWKFVLSGIFRVPIYGLGNITAEYFMDFFGFPYGYNATHAHFLLLDLIVQTGIIGLIAFLGMLFGIRFKRTYFKNFSLIYVYTSLLSFLMLCMFDSYPFLSMPYFAIGYIASLCRSTPSRKSGNT